MAKKLRIFFEKVTYSSKPQLILLSRKEFLKLKEETTGKGVICRIATEADEKELQQVERDLWHEKYTAAIAKKYSVGLDWRGNRWFVEQVRPTL